MRVLVKMRCQDCRHRFTVEMLNPTLNRDADGSERWHGFMGSDANWCRKCEKGVPEMIATVVEGEGSSRLVEAPTPAGVEVLRTHVRQLREVIERYQEGDAGLVKFEEGVKRLMEKSLKMVK